VGQTLTAWGNVGCDVTQEGGWCYRHIRPAVTLSRLQHLARAAVREYKEHRIPKRVPKRLWSLLLDITDPQRKVKRRQARAEAKASALKQREAARALKRAAAAKRARLRKELEARKKAEAQRQQQRAAREARAATRRVWTDAQPDRLCGSGSGASETHVVDVAGSASDSPSVATTASESSEDSSDSAGEIDSDSDAGDAPRGPIAQVLALLYVCGWGLAWHERERGVDSIMLVGVVCVRLW